MKKRIFGGALVVVVFGVALYFGGYVLAALLCAMSVLAAWEFARALKPCGHRLYFWPMAVLAILWYAFLAFNPFTGSGFELLENVIVLAMSAAFCLLLFAIASIAQLFGYPDRTVADVSFTFYGFVYTVLLLSCILMIRSRENGLLYSIFVFVIAWSSDISAYFAGSLFGKKKIFPVLSPHKTLAGAIGAVLGAMLCAFLYGLAVRGALDWSIGQTLAITLPAGALGSLLAQAGDLLASSVKRLGGVKDFGKLIPGHGGILDRFDSVLLVAPAVELLLFFLEDFA